jgi:hypothetical protein
VNADNTWGSNEFDGIVGTATLGEERAELSMRETGQWVALSETSAHLFDLDARRVYRMPGFRAVEFVTDTGRGLRTLDVCKVGELGEWTMYPLEGQHLIEFAWHISTKIVKIARVEGLSGPLRTTR